MCTSCRRAISHERIHRRTLAEQMYWNNGSRRPSDRGLHVLGIEIERLGIDVHEDGLAPTRQTQLAVAKNVKLGTITSSPAPMPTPSWPTAAHRCPSAADRPRHLTTSSHFRLQSAALGAVQKTT